MKKLLLITGELASGKSTLAHADLRSYPILGVTKDRMKEILADTVGFSDRAENRVLSNAVFATMHYLFLQAAEGSLPLLLESNFRQHELDLLYAEAERLGYSVLTVALTGDLTVLHRRFLARIASGTRHRAHRMQDLTEPEDFAAISVARNPRTYRPPFLILDTTAPDALLPEVIPDGIRAFLSD